MGFDVINRSTTDELILAVVNNDGTFTHENATFLNLKTYGMSSSLIAGNRATFSGIDSTGMRANLATEAVADISDNVLTFTEDGGSGMLFNANAPSIFTINNNNIGLADTGGLIEEGIRFLTSIGSPVLHGNQSNTILLLTPGEFIEIPFSFAGTPIGFIIVNGVAVP